MNKKWNDFGIQATFLLCLALIGILCFTQGRWAGMELLCPEPGVIGKNRTSYVCYSPEYWAELTAEPMETFDIGGFDGLKT